MKKIILTALMMSAFMIQLVAQKSFEGTIKFSITYSNLPPEMAGYESMLPKESITKIKGEKSRTEQQSAMGTNITIADKAGNVTVLMNMMGQKMAIKQATSDKKEETQKPTITYIDETKQIAGYKCKKAELKFEGEEQSLVVYYTEDIQTSIGNTQMSVDGLKGFMMEYSMENQGMEMTISASSVTKEKIADAEFTIPSDYEIITKEEFQKMMSGGLEEE